MPNKFKYKDWTFVEYINSSKESDYNHSGSSIKEGFFNDLGKVRGKGGREEKVFKRLIDWFKHIDNEPVFGSSEIWDSLDTEEREEWFGNSKSEFSTWWDELTPRLKYYYTDRLMSDKPMLTTKDDESPIDSYTPQDNIQITIINDKLAITSSKIEVLDDIKSMIERLHGEIDFEHRTKSLPMNKQSHTYIFNLKK